MAERRNGMIPHSIRRHGSEQRGVAPVPRGWQYQDSLRQSQLDRQKTLQAIRSSRESERATTVESGLGNRELPVFKHKQQIVDLVDHYKAIILGGPTGSGKSTQVPQYLFETGYRTYMLVPRRIIADGLHERLIEELSEHIGKEAAEEAVGIAHGERSEHSEESRITVMTPNTFARMAADVREKYGDEKVAIISDEIHEANLYTEIATGIAAEAVSEHDSWRLIAASATHNAEVLERAFSDLAGGFVPSINIEGRPFEVDVQESPEESPMQVYARMGGDHAKSMVFTSGKHEIDHIIEQTKKTLEASELGSSRQVVFRKLHGELNDIERSHINDPVQEGQRLVIVSSPAGMSGITIPGVTLVITDGTINRKELDDDEVPGLVRHYLSKAEIIQQMGRAGRDVPGGIGVLAAPTAVAEDRLRAQGKEIEVEQMPFVPLAKRQEFGPPEIYHSNLSQVVLTVASLDRSFTSINPYLPHQVESSAIIKAEETLARIGALDDDDAVTPVGRKMSAFQVRPELSRGIVEAIEQGRTLQQLARIAYIASALETGGVQDFLDKKSKRWQSLLRPTTTDDVIAQLDLVLTETPTDEVEYVKFLAEHDLSFKRMERARKVGRKMLQEMGIRQKNIEIVPPTLEEEGELRSDLTAGMIDLVYERSRMINKRQHYQNIHGGEEAKQRFVSNRSVLSPSEHQYIAGFPRWYNVTLRQGGKRRNDIIELVMPVDPEVVGEFAARNQLLGRTGLEAFYDRGVVRERYQPVFGSITVGQKQVPERHTAQEDIPKASQELLAQHVLERPGEAQRALREIADEIDRYRTRLPSEFFLSSLRTDAPEIITKETIAALVRQFSAETRIEYEVDQKLAHYIFRNNAGIERFFDSEVRRWLWSETPDTIIAGSLELALQYDEGEPYITARPEQYEELRSLSLYLPSGREVYVQIPGTNDKKIRVSTHEL